MKYTFENKVIAFVFSYMLATAVFVLIGCAQTTNQPTKYTEIPFGDPIIYQGPVHDTWVTKATLLGGEQKTYTYVVWSGYREVVEGTYYPVIGDCWGVRRGEFGTYLRECD